MTMVPVLVGQAGEAGQRGRLFGLLNLLSGLGLTLGGWASGPIADRWGFPALFAAYGAWALLNATPWIGIVLGLSAGGVAINAVQIHTALLLALVPAVGAILLLMGIRSSKNIEKKGKPL